MTQRDIRTGQNNMTIRDPKVMRAMAHPARLAVLEYLAGGQAATATECAEVCGLSPSATSYHLRELAKAGLIDEAPSRGDGRERVWRSAFTGYQVVADQQASPELRSATLDLVTVMITGDEERARRWFARSHEEPQDWYDAACLIRSQLLVTAAELRQLSQEIADLMAPYLQANRDDPPENARSVAALFRAFPSD